MIWAHGIGGRSDLPLPEWLFAYTAALALLISFVALRILWPAPRLAPASEGRPVGAGPDRVAAAVGVVARLLTYLLAVAVLVAAWFGPDDAGDNLAPITVYVVFWVGLQVLCAAVGDLWRVVSPFDTFVAPFRPDPDANRAPGAWAGHWPAAVGLLSFLWLELCYHTPSSPRAVAVWLTAYSGVVVGCALRWGRGWLRTGEAFAVLFSLLGALSPLWRGGDGRLRVRLPASGLTRLDISGGTSALVLALLGGTAFDGVSRTEPWRDLVAGRRGWDLTALNTVGLLLVIAVAATLHLGASRLVDLLSGARAHDRGSAWRWTPSLVPIALGYAVAHYFSLLVFEGRAFFARASDPFGYGWDLFGTADWRVEYQLGLLDAVPWVQVAAIVGGHVAGVVVAHDTAVSTYPEQVAVRSQYPLLALMVAYTVGGLLLLLGA